MKKNKKNRTNKIVKARSARPDDYFRHGPFEMARFGENIVSRNNMTTEQFMVMQDNLVLRYPEVCSEIDEKVNKIVELVKLLPPEKVLHRAAWNKAVHHLGKKTEAEIDIEAGMSMRMIDYVQSIIVAVPPATTQETDLTDERWQELEKLVHELFKQVVFEFMVCQTAVNRRKPDHDDEFDEFFFKAQLMWCTVRGKRYVPQEIPFYRDVLTPHEAVLKEIYGIGVEKILEGLQQIQESGVRGIPKATEDMIAFRDLTLGKLEKKLAENETLKEEEELSDLMRQVIEENGLEEVRDDVFGRLFGLDIFDLEKITKLPKALLDDLSLAPGQDTAFFAAGQYRGWPLRIWPVFRFPFIKLDGSYYCFETYSVFDNLYRIMQRIITSKKPEYAQLWNEKQKELSEQIPIQLFEKLLPGSKILHPVYYRWQTSTGSSKQWCEADILVIYEDHLFIIEVKGGAFTYTPPTTDFPAYVESLRNLVLKPAEQGKRFLQYLRSQDEVLLYDEGHKELGKICCSAFQHITICAITLDSFTEIAGQVQHLRKIGIDVGPEPVWSISIDDLRVYSDIFDTPLIFLHFVEQRMRAFHCDLIRTDDELDHLGLYIKHNAYTEYVKGFKAMDAISWFGFRSDIDRYYYEKILAPDTKSLIRQKMPYRLEEIVNFLTGCLKPGRRKVASMLLDSSGELRDTIASSIDEVLVMQRRIRRVRPFAINGYPNITVFCWQNDFLIYNKQLAIEHAYASMLATDDPDRLLVELFYDEGGRLFDVSFDFLEARNIAEPDVDKFKDMAESLRCKRVTNAKRTGGKIGRNDQCPCGSGKKFKKCCISRG